MTDEQVGRHPADGDDEDGLGEPIAELRGVEWPVSDVFGGRVRNRIERRVLGNSLLELCWTAPAAALLEFLRWPLERLSDHRK